MENIEIDKMNTQVTLRLNMDLYNYEATLQASKKFSENFWVIIEGNPTEKLIVHLKPKPEFVNDVNLDELGYEFYNFTLSLMQNILE